MSFDSVIVCLHDHIVFKVLIFFNLEGFLELSLVSLGTHSFHYADSLRQILLLEKCVWVFSL